MPRMLGFAFIPLSLYFCDRKDGVLAAILYEVNCAPGKRQSALRVAVPRYRMSYAFGRRPKERVAISIAARDKEGPVLNVRPSGERISIADTTLLRVLFAYPFLALKLFAAIHWEALRLWLKGACLTERPTQVSDRAAACISQASPCLGRATLAS
jgi:uncharacterized protein